MAIISHLLFKLECSTSISISLTIFSSLDQKKTTAGCSSANILNCSKKHKPNDDLIMLGSDNGPVSIGGEEVAEGCRGMMGEGTGTLAIDWTNALEGRRKGAYMRDPNEEAC